MSDSKPETRPDSKKDLIKRVRELEEENSMLNELLAKRIIDEKKLENTRHIKSNYDLMYLITTKISNSPNMEQLMGNINLILAELKDQKGFEEISIFLYDTKEDVLRVFASSFKAPKTKEEKLRNEARRNVMFRPGTDEEGLCGHVFRTGETRYTEVASEDPVFMGWKTDSDAYRNKSFLTVPLRTDRGTIGVISAMADYIDRGTQEKNLITLANTLAQELSQQRTLIELEKLSQEHLLLLAYNFDMRNPYFAGHSVRVADYSVFLAKRRGVSKEEIVCLKYGCLLHDVGKTGVDNRIIMKNGLLDGEEIKKMREHTILGRDMVRHTNIDRRAKDIVFHHHEFYDGNGYPDGLDDDNIMPLTKIVVFADTWDAMMSDRTYRNALTLERAREEIENNRGKQFSPDVVDVFLANYDAFLSLTRKLSSMKIVELEVQKFMADPNLLNTASYLIR